MYYDHASKAHLTSATGPSQHNDYKSLSKVYHHGNNLEIDPGYKELDFGVHKFMKKTTFRIGKEGEDAPNEKVSSNQVQFPSKPHDEDKNEKVTRRADPSNPNRIMTVGFGHGVEGGTKMDQPEIRGKTYYNQYFEPKSPDL